MKRRHPSVLASRPPTRRLLAAASTAASRTRVVRATVTASPLARGRWRRPGLMARAPSVMAGSTSQPVRRSTTTEANVPGTSWLVGRQTGHPQHVAADGGDEDVAHEQAGQVVLHQGGEAGRQVEGGQHPLPAQGRQHDADERHQRGAGQPGDRAPLPSRAPPLDAEAGEQQPQPPPPQRGIAHVTRLSAQPQGQVKGGVDKRRWFVGVGARGLAGGGRPRASRRTWCATPR